MAVKTIIYEICPKCGRVAARQDSDGTVHTIVHGCVVRVTAPRSFLPSEAIFVPMSEPLTDNELDELEQWGTRFLRPFNLSGDHARRIVDTIKTLRVKNKQLSSDFREMAKDCAKLQKVLLDIGHKVCDVLGVDIAKKVSDLRKGSWQCNCGMWHFEYLHSCCNCGRSKP